MAAIVAVKRGLWKLIVVVGIVGPLAYLRQYPRPNEGVSPHPRPTPRYRIGPPKPSPDRHSEARMRMRRSLDTCSRLSFRIAVTRVREVPARLAISACVISSLRAISFRRLSSAYCTCHSFAAAAERPRVPANSSGVLATMGLTLRIEKLLGHPPAPPCSRTP